jgi:thiosulfate dehydrogenase
MIQLRAVTPRPSRNRRIDADAPRYARVGFAASPRVHAPAMQRAPRATLLVGVAALVVAGACRLERRTPLSDTARRDPAASSRPATAPFRVPKESEITDSIVLASARRGRAIVLATRDSLPTHVGNALRCVSCHPAEGTQANAMPWVGVYARFPQYRSRNGHSILLEDRINDCFERSLNGHALAREGRDMRDIVAYMAFLSYGVPVGATVEGAGLPQLTPLAGDTVRGAALYAERCTVCHGAQGQGTVSAPPAWGPMSYNIGAGMARIRTAAAFIKRAMPFDKPGTLTDQQVFDVATYINSRPRPDFATKADDWPNGDPPPDVPYATKAAAARGRVSPPRP